MRVSPAAGTESSSPAAKEGLAAGKARADALFPTADVLSVDGRPNAVIAADPHGDGSFQAPVDGRGQAPKAERFAPGVLAVVA